MRRSARQSWTSVLVAVLTLSALSAACGTEDDASATPRVATLQDGKSAVTSESQPSPAGTADRSDQLVKFAACMRANGVDMADPEVDEDGKVRLRMGAGAKAPGSSAAKGVAGQVKLDPDFEKAQKACQQYAPKMGAEMDPEKLAELREGALDYAKCMRAEGVDMPDPEFGNGGLLQLRNPEVKNVAEFEAAEKVCRKHLAGLGPQSGSSGTGASKDKS